MKLLVAGVVAGLGVFLALEGSNRAAPPPTPKSSSRGGKLSVAPVKKPVSVHAPYEMGACSLCHERDDPKDPGKPAEAINKTCYSCHEGLEAMMATGKFKHAVAEDKCTNCHNPHNAEQKKLLLLPMPQLCTDCHEQIAEAMESKVKHAALTDSGGCGNCHNPHATEVQKLLAGLPFDLCVNCHSKDEMVDAEGVKLTNFKQLLANNPNHHSPVKDKDCSACHQTHGSQNFRLLVEPYPSQFYAPFKKENYALCFGCHDDARVTEERTTTATRFRDGDRNLHFLHVNKATNGRTCRACHEVHASPQAYQIRDGVPYGSRGWILKLNYKQTPDGGSCEKTCHPTATYSFKKK